MDINTNKINDVTVVEVSGDVDGSTSPILQEHIVPLVESQGRLLLDLTNVPFLSSAGLRVLVLLARKIAEAKGQVVLTGLSEEIHDTMQVTGFLKFFTVAPTISEGLQALAAG